MKQPQGSKSWRGATILELILVLALAGVLLVFGVKSYQTYQTSLDLQKLRYNADQLLEAAASYYQANCQNGTISPNPPNFLSPYTSSGSGLSYPPAATSYFPIPIIATLETLGFLENWSPSNALVDAAAGEGGYIVQLNPVISTLEKPVNACVVLSPGTVCQPSTPTSTIPAAQAQIVSWVVQVAVKIKDENDLQSSYHILNADCLSDETGGSSPPTVDPCSAGNSSQKYLVWSRVPSSTTLNNPSVFTTSTYLLRQANLQYTHDQNYEFNSGYSTTTSPSQAPIYYLCGG